MASLRPNTFGQSTIELQTEGANEREQWALGRRFTPINMQDSDQKVVVRTIVKSHENILDKIKNIARSTSKEGGVKSVRWAGSLDPQQTLDDSASSKHAVDVGYDQPQGREMISAEEAAKRLDNLALSSEDIRKSHDFLQKADTAIYQESAVDMFGDKDVQHIAGQRFLRDTYQSPGKMFGRDSDEYNIYLHLAFWIFLILECIAFIYDVLYTLGRVDKPQMMIGVLNVIAFFGLAGCAVWRVWVKRTREQIFKVQAFTNMYLFDSSPISLCLIALFHLFVLILRGNASNTREEAPYALYIPVNACWIVVVLILYFTRFQDTLEHVKTRLRLCEEMGIFGDISCMGFYVHAPKVYKVVGSADDIFNTIFLETLGTLYTSNLCDVMALVLSILMICVSTTLIAVLSFQLNGVRMWYGGSVYTGDSDRDETVKFLCAIYGLVGVWIGFCAIKVTWKIERLRQYVRTIRYKLDQYITECDPNRPADVTRHMRQIMEARQLLLGMAIPSTLRYVGRFFSIVYFPLLMIAMVFGAVFWIGSDLVTYETILVFGFVLEWVASFLIPLAVVGKLETEAQKHMLNLISWKTFLRRRKNLQNEYAVLLEEIDVWIGKIRTDDTGILMSLLGCMIVKATDVLVTICIAIVLACLTIFFSRVLHLRR